MIPKVIHYCWFGKKPMPEEYKKYIESWRRYCPDYEIKKWDESNFDLNSSVFVKEAYEEKKWAFVSDYARLKIIYDEGGIYLDTDVELLSNLDSFLDDKCFLAEETSGYINTGLGFGAEKGNKIIEILLEEYGGHFKLDDYTYDTTPCPKKNTMPLLQMNYRFSGKEIWRNEEVVVYPPEYFCPFDYETGVKKTTERTVSVHHYSASWHSKEQEIMFQINKYCIVAFGKPVGRIISNIINFPIKAYSKISRLGIKGTFIYIGRKLK